MKINAITNSSAKCVVTPAAAKNHSVKFGGSSRTMAHLHAIRIQQGIERAEQNDKRFNELWNDTSESCRDGKYAQNPLQLGMRCLRLINLQQNQIEYLKKAVNTQQSQITTIQEAMPRTIDVTTPLGGTKKRIIYSD